MLLLFKKDLKILLRDRKLIIMLILMPMLLSLILGFALKNSFDNQGITGTIKVGVVKEYNLESEVKEFKDSFEFGNHMTDDQIIANSPEKILVDGYLAQIPFIEVTEMTLETGREKLSDRSISTLIILPKGFVREGLKSKFNLAYNTVSIGIEAQNSSSYYPKVVYSIINSFSNEMDRQVIDSAAAIGTLQSYGAYEEMNQLGDVFKELYIPKRDQGNAVITEGIKGKKVVDSFTYYAIGMLGMFVLYSAGQGINSLKSDKLNHTYSRLRVAGFSVRKIMISKYFNIFAIVVLQACCLFLFSSIVLGVEYKNVLGIAILTFLLAHTISAIGLVFMTIYLKNGSDKIALLFQTVFVYVLALIGGGYIPTYMLPGLLQKLSIFTVNGTFADGMLKLVAGFPLTEIAYNCFILIIMWLILVCISLVICPKERRRA